MRLALGYPERRYELEMLDGHAAVSPLGSLESVCTCADITEAKRTVEGIAVSPAVKDYIVRIVTETRESPRITLGVSPRGTLALMFASRALAAIDGRDYVIPDDLPHPLGGGGRKSPHRRLISRQWASDRPWTEKRRQDMTPEDRAVHQEEESRPDKKRRKT